MLISSTHTLVLYARTLGGQPAAGLVLSDLVYEIRLAGVVQSITPTLTEGVTVGDRRAYVLTFTAPATVGALSVRVAPAAGRWIRLDVNREIDDVTQYTIDTLAGLVATPIVSVVNAGTPTSDISLRLVKDDYAPLTFSVRDQAGAAIDLSGYTSPTFAVLDRAQTVASRYTQTTGITLTALGGVTIAVPETASFYAFLTPVGTDSVTLYWTLKGNEAGDAAKTRTLARGTINVLRTETA